MSNPKGIIIKRISVTNLKSIFIKKIKYLATKTFSQSVACQTSHFLKTLLTSQTYHEELVCNQSQIQSSGYARGKINRNKIKVTKKIIIIKCFS